MNISAKLKSFHTDKFCDITLLSKYRTRLMGIAIIWVILLHYGLGKVHNPIIGFIGDIGYAGVDLFLFLSGLGIYFSLAKNPNFKDFYTNVLVSSTAV